MYQEENLHWTTHKGPGSKQLIDRRVFDTLFSCLGDIWIHGQVGGTKVQVADGAVNITSSREEHRC